MFTAKDIQELRNSLGLTLTGFAAALGVSEAAARRWEIGDRHPRYDTLIKMNGLAAAQAAKLNGRKAAAHVS